MAFIPAMEVRLELYAEGELPATLVSGISSFLSERWPESWDVKIPPRPSREHPAEWRAVLPLPDGATAESLHREMAAKVIALDPAHSLRLRTRWAFQESPNQQEVYEERWTPGRS
jgi:hypothetical protein